MNICLERRSISKAAITLSCCSFLFIASTQKPVAQTQTADTGNVNIFKALCYNVMPDIGKIKTMASRFRWVPITNQKKLAKTSGRPGKTQLINHFLINNNWFLVDLPGYGYAKVSKKTKSVFQQFITDYFETRQQLVCAFVLIDIRHEAQAIDIEFMSYMGESEIPFCIIFTKADKISKVKIDSHIAAYKKKT